VEGAGLDVETAFRISAVVGGEDGGGGGAGLLWRPQGPEGTFVAEPVEPDSEEAQGLLEYLREQGTRIAAMPLPPVPPEMERQRQLVTALEEQLALSPLHATLAATGGSGEASSEAALESLLAVRAELDRVQKRVARRARTLKGVRQKEWDDFLATVDLLESYGALVDTQQLGRDQPRNLQPSGLGQLVGTVRAENELWASLVLLSDGLADMEAVDLVGVISALANDITKTETKVTYSASEVAEAQIASLLPLREQLLADQQERGLSFPCPLDPLLAGVAQCWLAGFSWRELVETTNLDQGDVCRHIRKVSTRPEAGQLFACALL
jgi:superfamily II RNA helicase